MSNRRKPTRAEAFGLYCQMGSDRSLRKLHQRLTADDTLRAPSPGTLRNWSTQDDWPARAAEFDAQVAAETHERALEASADARWNAAKAFRESARVCVNKAQDAVPNLRVETPQHAQQLISAAIEAIKMAEVLDGGAKNGIENAKRSLPGIDDLDEYLASLDALIEGKPKTTKH